MTFNIDDYLTKYEHLGDLSATPPWHSRHMTCEPCRVSWTGCWDNFQCPRCGQGELPEHDVPYNEAERMTPTEVYFNLK